MTPIMRCATCGHDNTDEGYGPIEVYKQVPQCQPCLEGIKALEADGWWQDPETLQWVNPNPEDPAIIEQRGAVTELAFLLSGRGMDVVDIHPTSFVAVDAGDGFRLHVYKDESIRLFTDGRTAVPFVGDHMVMDLSPQRDVTEAVHSFLGSDTLTDIKTDFRKGT